MIYNRTPDYVIKTALDKSDGIMVALKVPTDAARLLALEGGQPPEDLHLTLAYLGKRDEFTPEQLGTLHDIVGAIARTSQPVETQVRGYDVFPDTDDGPCLYATVDTTQSLLDLQETVVEAVSSYGMPPQGKGQSNGRWIPHITLAYRESASPPDVPPVSDLTFDWLRVALGSTEALMRLKKFEGAIAAQPELKRPEDTKEENFLKGATTTSTMDSGGRIAPGQGRFRRIKDSGGLTAPTDGGEVNPLHLVPRRPKRTGEGTEAYTASNEIYTPTPGLMKTITKVGKAVAIDFDGTITLDEKGTENPKMRRLVDMLLSNGVRVVIFTARPGAEVHAWLREHAWPSLEVTDRKSPDFAVYLDDRAVGFSPDKVGQGLAQELAEFKTWWEKSASDMGAQPETRDRLAKLPAVAITNAENNTAEWNEAMHPRTAAGTAEGGQFAAAGGGNAATPADAPKGDADQEHRAQRAREWNKQHPDDQVPIPGDKPKTPTEDQARQAAQHQWREGNPERAAAADRWNAEHPGEEPAKPGGTARTDRTDEAAAWVLAHQGVPGAFADDWAKPAQVGDTLPGGGRVQPGDLGTEENKPLAPGLPTDQLGKEPRVGMPGGGTTPTPESVPGTPPTPESWGDLNADQQDKALVAWKNAARDDFMQMEREGWEEDESNFEHVPKDLQGNPEWNEQALKDINNGFYPGDPVEGLDDQGGGTPAAHAEQERRIAEWRDSFAIDDSIKAGAFSVDTGAVGALEVNTDLLVFKDNPYTEDSGQQMLPGIDREMMYKEFNKQKWATVKSDFEERYKEAFDTEVEKRVDMIKENPPTFDVNERMGDYWDEMDDKEKFKQAQEHLPSSDLRGGGTSSEGSQGEGEKGTVGPDKEYDTKEQKTIQSKKPTTKKNLGGGVSESKVVTMADGSKYVWKPSTGEANVRDGINAGVQYQREVAAYDIGRIVGMKNFMPVASIFKYEGNYGTMMEMIPDADNDGKSGDDDFADSALRGTFFDFIIGNTDRHGGNWMSDDDGKLWLIDNGLSFSEDKAETARFGMWSKVDHGAGEDDEIPESIKKPWKGKWSKIKEAMERRKISTKAMRYVEERYKKAIEDGVTWKDLGVEGAF